MISKIILWELETFVYSIIWGMLFAGIYCSIQIFRRVVKHTSILMMSIEDVIYGIFLGAMMFIFMYMADNGVVRGFILVGFCIGTYVFIRLLSHLYIKIGVGLLKMLLKPFTMFKDILKKLGNIWFGKQIGDKDDSGIKKRKGSTT